MRCPYCQHSETKVVDKRNLEEELASRRRRECLKCNKRFTTYERVQSIDLKVMKKDGTLQPYDREKLKKGILFSVQKRITDEEIDRMVDDLELTILSRKSNTVSTGDIGKLILAKLKNIDGISYLRFASVFLEFEDIENFKEEIKKLESL